MNKEKKVIFLIGSLLIFALIELFLILGFIDLINDKNAYINGLQNDKNICNGKLDTIIQDYEKIENELKEYQRKYGDE